jgi:hypothetical protein
MVVNDRNMKIVEQIIIGEKKVFSSRIVNNGDAQQG